MSDQIDYMALFGLEGEAGEEGADAADQPGGAGDEGEEEAGIADRPGEDDEPAGGEGPEEGNAPAVKNGARNARDRSRDAGFAAARREAEARKDAQIQALRAQHQRELDATVAALGIKNTVTGKLITTKAEYDAYMRQQQTEQREQFMRRAGMTQEEYDSFVASLPEVQQAKQQTEQARLDREKAQRDQIRADLQEQVRQIGTMDPTVKSLEDVTKAECYPQVYEMVKKGYALGDAWKIANFDRLSKGTAEAARQAERNAAAGKKHLQTTAQRGGGAVTVPKEIAAEYRRFDPKITDEEIRRDYARRIKN